MKKHIDHTDIQVLILGSGGREHCFAWKLSKSPFCKALYVAPGNSGTAEIATNLEINLADFSSIKEVVLRHKINMVVVGPEAPLVDGVHDYFLKDADLQKVVVIGPQKAAATLEGSKEFAKEFMSRHQIPTAAYQSFTKETIAEGVKFLEKLSPPYVLKADGLAAGKGVVILNDILEAKRELHEMLVASKFGVASTKVVIEEFLDGIELSCFVLTDGESYKILPTAKDYKRIGEGDTGLNTGGMGAISPVPFLDSTLMDKIEKRIVKPSIEGLSKDNMPYIGFLFIGLIVVDNEPLVIEYNVRMGDPETQVVIPRITTDLAVVFSAMSKKQLIDIDLEVDKRSASTVVLVSGGYPEQYEKNKLILGIPSVNEATVFHAGAKAEAENIVTNGGRVLAITALGDDYKSALKKSYAAVDKISFENMNYRTDIGFDL